MTPNKIYRPRGLSAALLDDAIADITPSSLVTSSSKPYMRALYDYGYRQIKSGQAWHKAPPELLAVSTMRP